VSNKLSGIEATLIKNNYILNGAWFTMQPQQHQPPAAGGTQYQSTNSSLQYDVVTMGTGCGKDTFEAGQIKKILNQHASQGKELVHMYQDSQAGCNKGVMLIMVFKYR
jgi:hypothetical protein